MVILFVPEEAACNSVSYGEMHTSATGLWRVEAKKEVYVVV